MSSEQNQKNDGPLSKAADTTTASTTGPNMSTETDPAKMPKEALEAEPDAGEQNQQREDAGMAALPTIT